MVFLNRERELELIEKGLRTKSRILVKGLRGVGKTALLKEVSKRVEALFIDCSLVFRPRHLAYLVGEKWDEAYEALEGIFQKASLMAKPLILDEFTDLLERFGRLKPYRGMGGSTAVASHFRGLVEKYEIPIAVTTTSLKTLYELTRKYSKPLARLFDVIISLKPLDFETSIRLASILAREKDVTISEEALRFLVEVSGGTPGYLKPLVSVLPTQTTLKVAIKVVEREFREGFFNTLFNSLLKELSPSEIEVLYLISRGYKTFSQLEKRTVGLNLVETLRQLESRELIEKLKRNRRVEYLITDKTFEAWLATKEFPGLAVIPFDRVRVSTLGFEALVRELFSKISSKIVFKDVLGREVTIPPVSRVYRYEGALGEIDAIVETKNGKIIVVETYFGGKCPPNKIDQLEKNVAIAEKITGNRVHLAILVSYFGFQGKTLEKARESKLKIILLAKKEIHEICEKTGYRKI